MTDQRLPENVYGVTRTLQIIVAALVNGVVIFGVIVLIIGGEPDENKSPLLTYIAVGYAICSLAGAAVIPRFIGTQRLRSVAHGEERPSAADTVSPPAEIEDLGSLLGVYQTRTIIRCAILEGAAFLCLVSYLIEHQLITVLAAAVLLAAILISFPTLNGTQRWLANQQKEAKFARQFSA